LGSARDVVYQGLLIQGYQSGPQLLLSVGLECAPVLLTGLAFLSIGESITRSIIGDDLHFFGYRHLAFLDGGWSSLVFAALPGEYCELHLRSGVVFDLAAILVSAQRSSATGLGL